ncbi:MAG: HlyD family efflux transporter periplasmic adaptor subunit [Phenylobacterium sp.]|uniref:HlyD family secretion protein n=1 Tax=Phenylobacterium sp. TaxID=1871053 RepID=UPI0025D09E5A|nr:HlyD family efflux transporter periplasmic adaptor subunit [Phenylobacterium sp.]MBT9470836.1 HlyD family efflux transporter periplasmic adaptor subunit [Phenylobacterium sp.]
MKRLLVSSLVALSLAACDRARAPAPPPDRPAAAVAKGVIEAPGGLVRLVAPRDGVLIEVNAEEGGHVAAGDILARLDDRQARLQLANAEADLGQRKAELAVAASRAAGAAREARRLSGLAAADAATRQDADQAATTASVTQGERRQAGEALQAAQARRQLAVFEVESRVVRAPVAGRIVRRSSAAGGYVAATAPLFVLAPDGARIVRAELDEAFADRVTPQSRALVTREFQTGGVYGARVLRVADALGAPSLGDEAASRADARVVTVLLSLAPGADLRLGQRVLVRFQP